MGFKDELIEFSTTVFDFQELDDKEYVDDEHAIAAINVLNFIKYKKVPDIFLGCAAYNLLSVYAKQKDVKISFQFRRHILSLLKGIEDVNQPKAIKIAYHAEEDSLLLIDFWNFQFSYKSQRLNDQVKNLILRNDIIWDGVRKQKCSVTIFNFAINNSWISNETMADANLKELLQIEIGEFKNDGYKFEGGRIVKSKNLRPAVEDKDIYLKNYIREKLYQCQDRPVIISGVYKKTWEKHITFTSIKPYIANTRVITICDHINLYRPDVQKVIDLNFLVLGKRYYIIGYCEPYRFDDRMGVQLVTNREFIPIFGIDEFNKMPPDILSQCHRFSIEKYLSKMQKSLKL